MTPDELRAWREARGWTQTQAADATGYKRPTWAAFEQERRKIPQRLVKIIEALGNLDGPA